MDAPEGDARKKATSMPGRWRSIARKALLLGGSVLVSLVLGEAAVRLVTPQRLVRGYFAADPELGNVTRANQRLFDEGSVSSYHVRTNRMGFRMDDEVDLSPARRRVLVVGDSYVFGWGVEIEDSFFARVDRGLRNLLPSVQLLNAGVGAYSTGHVYKTLVRADALDLCAAVYFMNSNDLADNLATGVDYRVTSYRRGSDGSIELKDELVYSPMKRFLFTHTPYGWLNQHSHLFILVKRFATRAPRQAGAPNRASGGPAFGLDPDSLEASELAIAVTLAHTERLQRFAVRRGLPLLVVWIPAWTELFRPESAVNEIFRELKESLEASNGFTFLDPLPQMNDSLDARGLELLDIFLPDGEPVGHFNRLGNEIYARAVEDEVIRFVRDTCTGP